MTPAETKAPLPETAARCGDAQPGSKTENGIPGAAVLLPDEIVARLLWSIDGAIGHQLRAHIEAQAAEIEALKADNATLYKGQQDMCADIREKQAEIERLRGALQFYADGPYVETYKNGIRQDAVIMGDRGRRAQEALAPCKTCGGDGWTKEGGKPFNDCPVCNGTGRTTA